MTSSLKSENAENCSGACPEGKKERKSVLPIREGEIIRDGKSNYRIRIFSIFIIFLFLLLRKNLNVNLNKC